MITDGGNVDGKERTALTPEDQIRYLVTQNQALELQLAQRTESSANASRYGHSLEVKLKVIESKYQEEQTFNMDTARDTTRQYKGMQEELITKLKQRERTIQELTDEIQTVKTQHAVEIEKKKRAVQNSAIEIVTLQTEIHEICKEFGIMLSTLTAHLQQSIDVQSCLKGPGQVPIRKRMEEFRLDFRPHVGNQTLKETRTSKDAVLQVPRAETSELDFFLL